MSPPEANIGIRSGDRDRALARRLFWVSAFLVAYAEVYPFHFVIPPSTVSAWHAFISDHSLWTSTGDVIGNVVLCLPLGAFGLAMPFGSRLRGAQLGAVFVLCVGYAFALQAVQIFFPPREASLSDTFWNTVGIALGMALGALLSRFVRAADTRLPRHTWAPLMLLSAWLLTQLAPFIPSIDWQLIKDAIKPLVINPHIDAAHLYYTSARVLAAGCLYAAVRPRASRIDAATGYATLLIAVLAAKLVIVGQGLTPNNVLGFGAGYAAWVLLQPVKPETRSTVALLALFVAYTVESLLPFQLRASPVPMDLLPFDALLKGAIDVNAWSLVEAVYVFGTVLWFTQRIGGSVKGSTVVLSIWVGMVEAAQMWIQGRTSDITMPLLVLAVGYLVHGLSARQFEARERMHPFRSKGTR